MTPVAIAATASSPSAARWDASETALAEEVAGDLADRAPIGAVFVAAPASAYLEARGSTGAVLLDRLGIAGRAGLYEMHGSEAAGAAALQAAIAYVAAGLGDAALAVGVAKVSDESEVRRAALMGALLDPEGESAIGLSYASLAGLLADLYLERYRQDAGSLAAVVIKNVENALRGGDSYWRAVPTVGELVRDIPTAPPLGRSDFAPLVDGATGVLVTSLDEARRHGAPVVHCVATSSATDVSIVAEREDPLFHASSARSVDLALGRARVRRSELGMLAVHNPCSIVELLDVESIGLFERGGALRAYADGAGRLETSLPINPDGGAQGRGHAFGVAGLEQAHEIYLQLSGRAGDRQILRASHHDCFALGVCTSGLGTVSHATLFGCRP